MKADTGGHAFPTSEFYDEKLVGVQEGMSLRDYFAGQALTGIIASYSGSDLPLPPTKIAAASAYDFADALVAERAK